jgi:hypothetical protein
MMSIQCTAMFLLLAMMSLLWVTVFPVAAVQAGFIAAGVAFLFVATAYAGTWPAMLAKGHDGRIWPTAWLLYWPHFLLTRASYRTYRTFWREPAMHEIVPGVHLGRRLTGRETRLLADRHVVGVLDLTAEFTEPAALRRFESFHCLPVLDGTAPSQYQLQAAVYWMRQTLRNGPAYVHCALGRGRSAAVVAAYLIAAGYCRTAQEAVELLTERRPVVQLTRQQRLAVEHFAAAAEKQ